MAPAIFYLRGIAPKNFRTEEMYLGVLPFIACQLLTALMVYFIPWTVLWLPTLSK
jgi:TRAP-type mannitol/chloroaromatic compound transport system permease large subunit